MKSKLVNNTYTFFLIRYFLSIFLCTLTLLITGKLGDIDFLLGNIDYAAGGTTSQVAQGIFSSFNFIGNKYLIICLVAAMSSFLLFTLVKLQLLVIWKFKIHLTM